MVSLPYNASTSPFSLMWSPNLPKVHSILLSMSLIKVLKSTSPETDVLGKTTCDCPPLGHRDSSYDPPTNSWSIWSTERFSQGLFHSLTRIPLGRRLCVTNPTPVSPYLDSQSIHEVVPSEIKVLLTNKLHVKAQSTSHESHLFPSSSHTHGDNPTSQTPLVNHYHHPPSFLCPPLKRPERDQQWAKCCLTCATTLTVFHSRTEDI